MCRLSCYWLYVALVYSHYVVPVKGYNGSCNQPPKVLAHNVLRCGPIIPSCLLDGFQVMELVDFLLITHALSHWTHASGPSSIARHRGRTQSPLQ